MAYSTVPVKVEIGTTITTKSAYGSHANMIVDHSEFDIELKEGEVLLKDDVHYYVTTKNRLDTGIADPKRWSGKTLELKRKS